MRFWTQSLTSGSIDISILDGAMFLSVKCDQTVGSCSVSGNIPFKGVTASPISLGVGEGINISALSPISPLDGINVTWISGTIKVFIGF